MEQQGNHSHPMLLLTPELTSLRTEFIEVLRHGEVSWLIQLWKRNKNAYDWRSEVRYN